MIPLFVLLLLCAASMQAQDDSLRAPAKKGPPLGLEDSLGITVKPGARDPLAPPEDSMRVTLKEGVMLEEAETKSPLGAVLRSAVIPGWGQLYNESYLKVPVVVGLTGFLVWGIVTEHATYRDYANLYDASITEENPSGNLLHKRFREFYRDRRDTYGWWLLVTYLLQLADAYVDAALFGFDVGDETGLTLIPHTGGVGMQLRF
ncbi:MAG: DUF5683 domain-containing protein [Bacteroidota bacterium]|nr:DUF5683 domain-containing protein [Bacteroidota bacterium]